MEIYIIAGIFTFFIILSVAMFNTMKERDYANPSPYGYFRNREEHKKNGIVALQRFDFWGINIIIVVIVPLLMGLIIPMNYYQNIKNHLVHKDLVVIMVTMFITLFTCLSLVLNLSKRREILFSNQEYVRYCNITKKFMLMGIMVVEALVVYWMKPLFFIILYHWLKWKNVDAIEYKLVGATEKIVCTAIESSMCILFFFFTIICFKTIIRILELLFTDNVETELLNCLNKDLQYRHSEQLKLNAGKMNYQFHIKKLYDNYLKCRSKIDLKNLRAIKYRSFVVRQNSFSDCKIWLRSVFRYSLFNLIFGCIIGLGFWGMEKEINFNFVLLTDIFYAVAISFLIITLIIMFGTIVSKRIRNFIITFTYGYSGYVYKYAINRNIPKCFLFKESKYNKFTNSIKNFVSYLRLVNDNELSVKRVFKELANVKEDEGKDLLFFILDFWCFFNKVEYSMEENVSIKKSNIDYKIAKAIIMDVCCNEDTNKSVVCKAFKEYKNKSVSKQRKSRL